MPRARHRVVADGTVIGCIMKAVIAGRDVARRFLPFGGDLSNWSEHLKSIPNEEEFDV
jgi:hypothetical protein